jgi:hypothetical protein
MKSMKMLKVSCSVVEKPHTQLLKTTALRWRCKKRSKIDVDFVGVQKLSLQILYLHPANAQAQLDLCTFNA